LIRNCTPVTPTLSEAVAASVTVLPLTLAPDAGEVIDTVGAVRSLFTVIDTAAEVVELPAASRAIAVTWCVPFPTVLLSQLTE
jgi:hypothetical protein